MDISYNWLREYVDFNLTPEELEKVLNSIGLEVEASEVREEIPGGLQGVVVAQVIECKDHPDSDHLHITKVDAGTGEPLQIVCGAPNVAAGQKVMLATVNTRLHFSNGEEVKIKKSKIRGVESFGMLCAEDELGIGTNHEGIMVLDNDAEIGTPAREYFKLESDTVFSIGRIEAPVRIRFQTVGQSRRCNRYRCGGCKCGTKIYGAYNKRRKGRGVSCMDEEEAALRWPASDKSGGGCNQFYPNGDGTAHACLRCR